MTAIHNMLQRFREYNPGQMSWETQHAMLKRNIAWPPLFYQVQHCTGEEAYLNYLTTNLAFSF